MCDKSRNTWLCVHWQWDILEWCQLNALQASPVVHLVTPLSCVSLLKGLRMVARALWRSEARKVVPWSETLQGRSQGTTLSASDLHNARATILNPFYNMEHKIIKKIRQNMTWIEEDILGINLTPNRYNALVPAIVYVSNDVTIPINSVTSQ